MNIRDIVIPAALTFATLFLVNQFFESPKSEQDTAQPGQSFKAPEHPDLIKPIDTHVDFDDTTLQGSAQSHAVDTAYGTYQFTNATGGIEHVSFVHPVDTSVNISTIDVPENEPEQYGFLTAFDAYTPYYYTLQEKREENNAVRLVYEGASSQARVRKIYTVDYNHHQVDLDLRVTPLHEEGCVPRVFLPAPYMEEIAQRDKQKLLVYNQQQKVTKHTPHEVQDQFWLRPSLFGCENTYFVHALVQDHNGFLQRGYARLGGKQGVTAVYEGPHIYHTQEWRLTFYTGPKEAEALNAVDPRLEATLDYGWLAPVSKRLLWLLKWIYAHVGNFGWAILALTALMRLLLLPFGMRSEPQGKKSQEFARKKKALEEKYKDDQETLAREQFKLAQEYGMTPTVMGCLPMLLQMPVFIGLNYALSNSIMLYKAPFIGWIQDLSSPDPYYILPICIGGSLFLNALSSQQRQQQMVFGLLGILLIGVTSYMSAGLALYIAVSSILGLMQTALTRKLQS